MPFNILFLLFALFITGCGLTHLMGAIVSFYPYYYLDFWIKMFTAIISLIVAAFFVLSIPKIAKIPNPIEANKKLEESNEELKKREGRITRILDAMPDGIIVVNDKGIIVYCNSQIEKLFIYDKNNIVNKPVEFLVPNDIKEKHITYRDMFINDAKIRPLNANLKLRGLKSNGIELPIIVGLSPFYSEEFFIVAIIREINAKTS